MYLIQPSCDSEQVYAFVVEWLQVLSRQDYQQAADMLVRDPVTEDAWTAENIRSSIESGGNFFDTPPESVKVTDPNESRGANEQRSAMGPPCRENDFTIEVHPQLPIEVQWYHGSSIENPFVVGCFRMFYPLNKFWGDVSSSFDIVRTNDKLGFALRYIDIM